MKYNPNKQYSWDANQEFVITGKELGLLSYTAKTILSTETARQVLLAERINNFIEGIIKKGVESGLMNEIPEEHEELSEKPPENETLPEES